MAKPTPLHRVKTQFGGKNELIEALVSLVEPNAGETSDQHKRRLVNVSNKKLLHLFALGNQVKSLGGRDTIVKRILELRGQSKDHEYGDKLKRVPLGKLVDLLGGFERTSRTPKAAAATRSRASAR